MSTRREVLASLAGCAGLLLPHAATAASVPKAEVWDRWTRHDPASGRVLNHTLWSNFLSRYLQDDADGIRRLRYADISGDDRGLLRVYLDELQRTEVSRLRRDEQRAYWINLFNAQTVKLVADRYPLVSIQQIGISPGFFAKGPWGAKLLKVEDENLTLDDIRHRILRPIWRDARTHYALNLAAVGSPNLAREPYTAANLERLLEAGARAFVNHPRGARVEDGKLQVSSLYTDYRDDFGRHDGDVIAHLHLYADDALSAALDEIKRISGDAFDWQLNDVRAAPA